MDLKQFINPSLEVFRQPIMDKSVTEFEYIEYEQRDTEMNKGPGGKYIFETKDLDELLLPHKAMLHIRFKIQNFNDPANPANYTAGTALTLVNNAWSIFSGLQYQIQNNIVEDVNQYLPQASTMLNLVMFSDDYSRSSATNQFWFKDTGGGGAELNLPVSGSTKFPLRKADGSDDDFKEKTLNSAIANNINTYELLNSAFDEQMPNPNHNQGFQARYLLTDGGKMVSVFLPLAHILGSHRDIDTVYRNVKHTYVLTRGAHKDCIFAKGGVTNSDKAQVVINHISLWMPKVRPSFEVLAEIEKQLTAGVSNPLYFEQVGIHRRGFAGTELSGVWRVATMAGESLPNHIFMCIQAQTQEDNQEMNNQIFLNGNVIRTHCLVNSTQYPEREFICDFSDSTGDYARVYMAFQEAVSKYSNTDSGSQVSIADFKGLYPIFHYDTSKRRDQLNTSIADITLKWRLSKKFEYPTGTDVGYNVYCLIISDRIITLQGIDGRMNIIV